MLAFYESSGKLLNNEVLNNLYRQVDHVVENQRSIVSWRMDCHDLGFTLVSRVAICIVDGTENYNHGFMMGQFYVNPNCLITVMVLDCWFDQFCQTLTIADRANWLSFSSSRFQKSWKPY